ncbi:MAG: hypothetical protein QM817_11175 [Archangium sp.]
MIRGLVVLASVAVAVSACRDLGVPPPPGPGTVSGRVVVAVPGVTLKQAVPAASVSLVSGSLSTTAGADGRFVLSGFTFATGTLRFRADVPGIGVRQKTITLESIGAGPGRNVELGDVAIVESAVVKGRALREDLIDSPTGHLNSVVFVPEGPFTAYTADDGTFALDELPEGPMQLTVFRTGYQPVGLELTPRSGELMTVRDLILQPLAGPELPGAITGSLVFVPQQPDTGDVTVRAFLIGGGEASATIDSINSQFRFSALAPGLYDLVATRSGFATAVMRNVLVTSGGNLTVGDIVLEQGVAGTVDAGVRPPPIDAGSKEEDAGKPDDAGTDGGDADAGIDAGVDAGTQDAGQPDAGPQLCSGNGDCPSTQWCDLGACRPQCVSSAGCTNGRVCDVPTGTCFAPCDAGMCGAGETCDPLANACRRFCDLSAPCPSGQRCNASSFCVPECNVTADCLNPYRMCQGGACVSNTLCGRDRDCPSPLDFCIAGHCATQTRTVVDGGYACSSPCQCREGEVCESSNVCVAEPLPTVYLIADGGGLGDRPDSGTGDLSGALATATAGTTLALRADDLFLVPSAQAFPSSGVTLAGGYVSCGSDRWVRDITKYSTIRAPLPPVFTFGGSPTAPRSNVRIENIDLRTAGNGSSSCSRYNFEASNTDRLRMHRVRSRVDGTDTCSGAFGMMVCSNCSNVDLDSLEQLPQAGVFIQYSLYGVQLYSVSGSLKNVQLPGSPTGAMLGVYVSGLTGPLTIDRVRVPPNDFQYAYLGVSVANCGVHRATISNSTLAFPIAPGPSQNGYGAAINVSNCDDVHVVDNLIDGSLQSGYGAANPRGLTFDNSGGEVLRNRVLLPNLLGSAGSSSVAAMHFQGRARFDVLDNVISGGTFTIANFGGLRLMSVANLTTGPMRIERNTLSAGVVTGPGNFTENTGIWINNVPGTVGLAVRDNVVTAPLGQSGVSACNASYGAHVQASQVLFERNDFTAPAGQRTNGVRIQNASTVELVGNHLFAGIDRAPGSGSCSGVGTALNASSGLHVEGAATQVFALGNTIEGVGDPGQLTPSIGVTCSGAPQGIFTSNVINGGRASTHWMLGKEGSGASACESPSSWSRNYFFFESPSGRSVGDLVSNIVSADAGVGAPDANGNILGDGTSCLDPGSSKRYHLLPGGPCIDRGDVGARRDNTIPVIDIDGLTRVRGVRADIGCSEEP